MLQYVCTVICTYFILRSIFFLRDTYQKHSLRPIIQRKMSVGKSTQLLILGSFTTWNHIDLNQASLRLSHNHKDKVARPHNKKTNGTLRVSPRLDFIPTAGPSLLLAMQQETPKSTKGEVCSSLLGTRLAIFPHKCGFGPFFVLQTVSCHVVWQLGFVD